jgi:CHAT domain-containing protein
MVMTKLAEVALERGDLLAARWFIDEGEHWLCRPNADRRQWLRARGQALIARGKLEHAEGEPQLADQTLESAREAFRELDELAGEVLVLAALMDVREDPDHALAREATELIERHRQRLQSSDLRMRVFAVTAGAVKTSVRGSLLADRPDEALESAERAQARELAYWLSTQQGEVGEPAAASDQELRLWEELHRRLEQEPASGPRHVRWSEDVEALRHRYRRASRRVAAASRTVAPPTLGQLSQLTIDDRAALIEFVLDEPIGDGLVLAGGMLTAFELPARSTLEADADHIWTALSNGEALPEPSAHRLSDAVLAPAIERADEYGGDACPLIIVPDGALHRVPVAALLTQPHGQPLAMGHASSLAPSGTVVVLLRLRSVRRPKPSIPLVTAAGPGLTHVWREVAEVAEELEDGCRASSGGSEPAATAEDVIAQLDGGAGVLHLAAHSQLYPGHPELAAVVLANAAAEPCRWAAWQIARARLHTELVYLSLCSSGEGPVVVGEGPLSLARAFLIAGARCVVVTLWPVLDRFAAEFAPTFYGQWRGNTTAGEALAAAQRRFLDRPPADWAAFALVGDAAAKRPSMRSKKPPDA